MPNVCSNLPRTVVGPFEQTLFLGCSVKSFTCTVGWNEQQTNLTVELVEDPCPGNKIYHDNPGHTGTWTAADPGFEKYRPTVGAPVYFRVQDFEFAGIVQSWSKSDSTSGLNQYSVNISDPRFILQNTQLILNENNGSVGGLYNVINVFGYLEESFGIDHPQAVTNGMGLRPSPSDMANLRAQIETTPPACMIIGPNDHTALAYALAKEYSIKTVEFSQLGKIVEGENAYLTLMQGAVSALKTCFQ